MGHFPLLYQADLLSQSSSFPMAPARDRIVANYAGILYDWSQYPTTVLV
jgi:hypothetical protein